MNIHTIIRIVYPRVFHSDVDVFRTTSFWHVSSMNGTLEPALFWFQSVTTTLMSAATNKCTYSPTTDK